jgi:hypothetical protein
MKVIAWNGKKITEPGFYAGVSMDAYHSGELCDGYSLSSGGHRTITMRSEAHFYDRWPLNPNYDKDANKPNEGMVLGRATHHLLLSIPFFSREYTFEPDTCADANGEVKKWSRRFASARKLIAEEEAKGRTVLTQEQGEAVKGMALRLGQERPIHNGVLNGHVEVTMAWRDRETDVWCLSRPDVIPTDSGDFTDLKTTSRIVSVSNIVAVIGEFAYHQQAALCGEGWRILTGQPMASFGFYFVETSRPYCCHMVQLKPEDLALGERQNRLARKRFVRAVNSGRWPGPNGSQEMVPYVDLSDRLRLAIENDLSRHEGP